MQQKAEVLELKQTPQEHDSPNAKWLADKEKQLNNLDKEEHEVVAEKMWQRGKVFFEIRKRREQPNTGVKDFWKKTIIRI